MDSIYQLMFFLSLVLLAIVITVYVLAVSLLGRAVRLSSQEQTEAEEKRKKDTEDEISKIQEKLEQAKAAGRADIEGLTRSLQGWERKESKHKWKLRWVGIKPKFLTATWGALIPGGLFLISAIFSALVAYSQSATGVAPQYMCIALTALGLGIVFVCLTLKVVEGVAISSEETALIREKEALKTAFREVEEEKKPKLKLIFKYAKPPFHVKSGEQLTINFVLDLEKGYLARSSSLYFFAPRVFDFVDVPKWVQSEDVGKVGGCITTILNVGDVREGMAITGTIAIKAPSDKRSYSLWYRLICESFSSEIIKFKVVVE